MYLACWLLCKIAYGLGSVNMSSRILGIAVFGLVLVGCTTQPVREQPPESVEERLELGFIKTGSTTRSQVLDELGEPFFKFDDERIYTYYLTRSLGSTSVVRNTGCCGPGNLYRSGHQLILVFDSQGILQRYSYLRRAARR